MKSSGDGILVNHDEADSSAAEFRQRWLAAEPWQERVRAHCMAKMDQVWRKTAPRLLTLAYRQRLRLAVVYLAAAIPALVVAMQEEP